ncbi:DUF481 domain-containing protein [Shewanella violacea]|uniref:DUF481 domain-containing protein n=1 Tax=Shewanella violacea (strain JCM 10179 / CIP 106290 / LMG 19151 / DSS12) TaxID=637905 RepID=D4ZIS8_SHEVD|nr:DUF481 domain-containing protein [Shewanella violacea]BAJ01577.1 hypothetical protein SVI_1606 [Shewanella violacea DSS12]
MKSPFNKITFYISAAGLCLPLFFSANAAATSPQKPQMTQLHPGDLYPPADADFDWIQLTSNELLKGKVKNLYDDKLEFESDELSTLYIDWADIKVLQSEGVVSIGFTDLTTKTGKLLVKGGKTFIDGEEFDSTQIMTIIAGKQTEANYWSSKVSLGANLRSGNTDQVDYSAIANTRRRTTESRYNLDYIGNYSKTDGDETINNQRINTNFDWYLSKQFYLRPVFAEIYIDPFLNYKYKATLGFGVGYDIIDSPKTNWSISGGPAYTYTKFDNVLEGQSEDESSAALVVETVYDTEVTDDIDFNTLYRVNYGSDASGGYTHHALAGFSIALTDMFDLDLSFVWDHINKPQQNADMSFPKQDDYQFIIGFGIDL